MAGEDRRGRKEDGPPRTGDGWRRGSLWASGEDLGAGEEQVEFDAKIDAMLSGPSLFPDVTVMEWTILVRCNADRPVDLEDVFASLTRWLAPFPSLEAVTKTMMGLDDRAWLKIDYVEPGVPRGQTTALGVEVLNTVQRPLLLAGTFGMTGMDWAQQSGSAGKAAVPPKHDGPEREKARRFQHRPPPPRKEGD